MGLRPGALEAVAVTSPRRPDVNFWRGKRILLTGHTGFKGAWLALWLRRLGADVTGVALAPQAGPNLFMLAGVDGYCDSRLQDIRDPRRLSAIVKSARPQIVLHLAAQALVRTSYRDPIGTFTTNLMGTTNLLDALRGLDGVRVAVMVTTDKVYRNLEQAVPFRETDELGGHDPYSASKAAAEVIIASCRDAFLREQGVAVASARAGNVIGGGDWSEDRLLPDAVRAWQAGEALHVRRPAATRPWQHVLEPLAGYLMLAETLWDHPALAGPYNFGPATEETATVRAVIDLAHAAYGEGEVRWGDGTEGPHEAGMLALDIGKARATLGFTPLWTTAQAVGRSLAWYRAQHDGAAAHALCEAEIAAYEAAE
ncbi:MAG: CDP-glucose 4,6-dehydratase [Rhizobium sp.]|nr:CDP-glucose 4,6-dehydratase [Rhizobium sp.]